ncbi:BolA family protein [Neogemmobacter tilapiae]|uniref:BolA family transcriptional regulator n=1 Tax=Neogemmobacter tilapiae TaxID=875041 RepID=A0A918WPT3_9RHOB|nr:BolA family protein [Gemmobacter tilapiae]GHC62869.1 BolA family transcriptional regulator [Gemmobacter tilapiae]
MTVEQELQQRLTAAFQPTELDIRNDSHRHHGHAGDDGSGESHFHVLIRAPALAGMGRVARHRAVHHAIGDLNTRIHALGIDAG